MEPITTLTATAIANLAFQEFIKSGAGELAKKFTAEAIAKMSDLRQLLWERLRSKHAIAQSALEKAATGDQESIATIGKLLDVEMLDRTFATQIHAIAQEINAGKLSDQSTTIQNNYDSSTGIITNVMGGIANIGTINQYGTNSKPK